MNILVRYIFPNVSLPRNTRYYFGMSILAVLVMSIARAEAACWGTNYKTGNKQTVREVYRTGVAHPKRYIAEATYSNKNGQPLIIYYKRYTKFPALYRSFIRLHECCHHAAGHSGFSDEVGANCCALRRMRLTRARAARIRNIMISHNINSNTVIDYPGQGAEFWSRTAARCPKAARRQ